MPPGYGSAERRSSVVIASFWAGAVSYEQLGELGSAYLRNYVKRLLSLLVSNVWIHAPLKQKPHHPRNPPRPERRLAINVAHTGSMPAERRSPTARHHQASAAT